MAVRGPESSTELYARLYLKRSSSHMPVRVSRGGNSVPITEPLIAISISGRVCVLEVCYITGYHACAARVHGPVPYTPNVKPQCEEWPERGWRIYSKFA